MATFLLAQQTSDNAPEGAFLSLWLPLGLFIIVAAVLWVIYARPHNRVPPRSPAHGASSVAGAPPVSGSGAGPSARPEASSESAADDSGAQQPEPPQPGPDDTGHRS